MVSLKRKKNSRQRGSKTHGWGSMKKHRGAGHRGGRGAAGSGKRGDAKKPSIWRSFPAKGKAGFSSVHRPVATITIAYLERFSKTLESEGWVKADGDKLSLDLGAAGFEKLLGTGSPSKPWAIRVPAASERAIEKIKNAGGSVTVSASADGDSSTASEQSDEA